MRVTPIPLVVIAVLVAAALFVRGLAPGPPAERDAPVRPSLHAAPAADVAAQNTAGPRRVPEALAAAILPDGRPAVVLFLKAGCGCSEDFARMFSAVEPHLRSRARCVAVIEADEVEGGLFLEATGLSLPHLLQPDGGLAAAWRITKAGCIALVGPDGSVEAVWPGISRQGFRDIAARLGDPKLLPDESLDSLPGAATAGCPLRSTSSQPLLSGVSR